MKKILALTLAVLLLIACVGCGAKKAENTDPTTASTTAATDPTTDPTTEPTEPTEENGDRTANYIQLSIYEEDDSVVSITAFDDDAGQAYVEYASKTEKKVGYMDLAILGEIAAAVEGSQLKALNEQSVYEDGIASASMYVSYTDESFLSADFMGVIPQEFRDGYAAVEAVVIELMKDVPVYVPAPVIESDVDADIAADLEAVLNASGAEALDNFYICNVPMDESFNYMMGLSKADGIASGVSCSYSMSSVAFSCVIAVAEDESAVAGIVDDFAANIDWNRWICVSATDAMIATKGNQVMCLVTIGDLYNQITTGAESNGWTVVKTLTN